MGRADFRGAAEPEEFEIADAIGPRAARIVGQPESVGGKDEVEAQDHTVIVIQARRSRGASC